jgi:hypothetical protein
MHGIERTHLRLRIAPMSCLPRARRTPPVTAAFPSKTWNRATRGRISDTRAITSVLRVRKIGSEMHTFHGEFGRQQHTFVVIEESSPSVPPKHKHKTIYQGKSHERWVEFIAQVHTLSKQRLRAQSQWKYLLRRPPALTCLHPEGFQFYRTGVNPDHARNEGYNEMGYLPNGSSHAKCEGSLEGRRCGDEEHGLCCKDGWSQPIEADPVRTGISVKGEPRSTYMEAAKATNSQAHHSEAVWPLEKETRCQLLELRRQVIGRE